MATPNINEPQPNQSDLIERIQKRLGELTSVTSAFKNRELNEMLRQLSSNRYSIPASTFLELRSDVINQLNEGQDSALETQPPEETQQEQRRGAIPEEVVNRRQRTKKSREDQGPQEVKAQEQLNRQSPRVLRTEQVQQPKSQPMFNEQEVIKQIQLQEQGLRKLASRIQQEQTLRDRKRASKKSQQLRSLQGQYTNTQNELFLNLQDLVQYRQQNYNKLQRDLIDRANTEGLNSSETQAFIAQLKQYGSQLDQYKKRYKQIQPDVPESLVHIAQQEETTRSQRLESAVANRIIKGNLQPGDPRDIEVILRSNNPLEVLGVSEDSDFLTTRQISENYKDILAGLYLSEDPRAGEARQKLTEQTAPFVDALSQEDSSGKIIEKSTYRKLRIEKKEQQEAEQTAKQARSNVAATKNEYADYGLNFSANEWLASRKKEYYERKRKAIRSLPRNIVLTAATATDLYETSPLKAGVDIVAKTRAGNWLGTKIEAGKEKVISFGSGAKSMLQNLDNNIAESVVERTSREVTIRKYHPRKRGYKLGRTSTVTTSVKDNYQKRKEKEQSVKTWMAVKALYAMTIGRVINTVKTAVRAARDVAYTKTGMKFLKNRTSALSSKISTKFWGGTGGKTVLFAQRGLNGLRAVGRAIPSGLAFSAVTGLVLAASGLGLPAVPIIGMGALASLAKIGADTLSSKVPSSIKLIYNLQEKFGVFNTQKYIMDVGMLEDAMLDGRNMIYGSRGRLTSLLRSWNGGMYGMGIGAIIGGILGSPLIGAAIGLPAGLAVKYALDRSMNNILANLATKPWFQTLSKMPFLEAVGLMRSIPWFNYHIDGFRKDFGKHLSKEWLVWKNPLVAIGNLAHLGLTAHSAFALAGWARAAMASLTTAQRIGAGLGAVAGSLAAIYIFGLPIGAGVIIGGSVGAMIGGALGTFIPIPFVGTTIGMIVGSFLGTTIGGFIDKLLGKVNVLEQLLGAFSGIKGILDFLKALSERFDPMGAFGLALTVIFSLSYLSQIQLDEVHYDNSKTDTQASGSSSSTSQISPILGENVESQTVDCLKEANKTIINPKTDTVIKILLENGSYQIHTNSYKFINILQPRTKIEVQGTLIKGELIGTCKN